ncbi:hypothetical protein L596_004227 [Steinernema carpocapsae]|uniref:Uncharacterized protein n=1 Tax=Steinernema carpocapsae TaxID=34508 RepID=A0A4V6I888_STECR|nr:hypothetical protein L596_004227 [Steinernema carpocapsae]
MRRPETDGDGCILLDTSRNCISRPIALSFGTSLFLSCSAFERFIKARNILCFRGRRLFSAVHYRNIIRK